MKKPAYKTIFEFGVILLVAILVAFIVRAFFLQLYFIPSGSMEPYLKIDDKIFVNKMAYQLHDVERGDLIVFSAPESITARDPDIKDLVKRVVGLPGETVEGRCPQAQEVCEVEVLVNGVVLNEPYLAPENKVYSAFEPISVPANSVLVLGDNRDDSEDGRFFKATPKDDIVGRAFFRVMPLNRFGFLS